MQRIKLFCFPYAGGSAAIFNRWKPFLHAAHPGIELIPVEPAGRGKRMHDPLYSGLEEAVDDLYQTVVAAMGDCPYAFFGHSLGAMMSYELAQKMRRESLRPPLHLFFSGRGAPNVVRRFYDYHLMEETEFRQKVLQLGGTPPEFFDHPELTQLFLPVLRNDFRLAETDLTQREIVPFDCDITVMMGKEDKEITAEQTDAWKFHTTGNCPVLYFNGDHFFLHQETRGITEWIGNTLRVNRSHPDRTPHTQPIFQ
jgi:medium-chain acyl-[acyl-carrier-protein] hydrolase